VTRRSAVRTVLFVAVLSCTLLVFPGCGKRTTRPASQTTYRFGVIVPLTGPGAALGTLIKRGIDLGVEDVNSAKSGLKLQPIFEDSKTDPSQGLTEFRKLTDVDKTKVNVVGFSAVCNAVAPAAEQSKTLMIGMTTSMPGLINGRKYVLRLFPNADMLAGTMAKYAGSHYSLVAVLYANDEYGQNTFSTFKSRFENQGRKVVFSESFKPTDMEFRSTVLKALAAKPDAVYLPGYGPGYIALMNQIRERNAQIPIIGDSPLTNPGVYRAAGEAAEGAIVPATPLDAASPKTQEQRVFLAAYQKKFHENPSINVTINYDFVHLLASALKETDGSPEAVRDYFLRQKPYHGLAGDIEYQPDGESVVSVTPMRIKGGTIVSLQ
jgi:branched-chain amino acid transport system substrate-binding protein